MMSCHFKCDFNNSPTLVILHSSRKYWWICEGVIQEFDRRLSVVHTFVLVRFYESLTGTFYSPKFKVCADKSYISFGLLND